ncbi:MAG TPA: bacteriohopanetetrol glucosamine biosynthesis glycosyltransferase HpnI [Acidobacteriaceae bacterium]|nr:bacteriohopanetetrol glucosamine biosynthesis glycosyltransferase HpnI [Acidobacteriaceae bacterium]
MNYPLTAEIVAGITTVLAWAGIGYYLLALWSARAFVHSLRPPHSPYTPGVSILKPLRGMDHEMYSAFASHCRQEYSGEFEILFGVSSLDDPAVAAVHELQEEFPDHAIRIIECPEVLGANGKVSNLVQMLPHARHPYVLINDSDIVVSPHYLSRVMAGFAPSPARDRDVGMVTAPYRGRAHGKPRKDPTLGSRMEALGISTDFFPGVLTARRIEGGIHFGLGSTLAVSREALDRIGGLAPLVDYLADDYELGARIAARGYAVELSSEVVETWVPPYDIAGFLEHQLRWCRSTRDSRRWGYTGLIFTFGLPWAFCNLIASGLSLESIALFVLALLVRVALALVVGVGVLGDAQVLRDLLLLLPRDLIALALWGWSFAGDTVTWRGERFLLKRGKLTRIEPKSTAS